MKRRTLLQMTAAGAGLTAMQAVSAAEKKNRKRKKLTFRNKSFYTDGRFDVEKGKDAVVKLCDYHGYPIFPDFREKLWVSDYNTGQFTELGLAACLFMNNEQDRYMLMDLFLLPGQMLPEHWHLDGETNPAKREGWLVRWGKSYVVGQGTDNLATFPQITIPKCHMNGQTLTKHVVAATPGMFVPLAEVKTRHWQYGGPQGAIITEVANVHTDSAVRHSDKEMNDFFLKG